MFQSVGSGVIGIVAEPVKGAKRSGAKGFFTVSLNANSIGNFKRNRRCICKISNRGA